MSTKNFVVEDFHEILELFNFPARNRVFPLKMGLGIGKAFGLGYRLFMEFINIFLAQAATTGAAAGPAANPLLQFVPLVFIVIIFYFMLIRPQQKRQKEHQALISAVKVGDRVITSSGIHGLVQSVKDKTVMVKVADNVKIEFDKASIGSVERSSSSEEEVKAS